MIFTVKSESETIKLGQEIGAQLSGGEIIELIGDVGSGKTTLTKGIAIGLGITEYIQSPSFTINRVYKARDEITLTHYDFYRLTDAGIMANEMKEVISDNKTVTVVEWAEAVKGVLPIDRVSITISALSEDVRKIEINSGGSKSDKLVEVLKNAFVD